MVEQYLGKETADDIFFSSMLANMLNEKQASEAVEGIQKGAQVLDELTNAFRTIGHGAMTTLKSIPPAVGGFALGGAATGAIGATIYDILKERVSQEDPETKFNSDIEKIYRHKKREIDDSRWMDRVRSMRDELKRGYKKMTTDEYASKYKELMDALDERSE